MKPKVHRKPREWALLSSGVLFLCLPMQAGINTWEPIGPVVDGSPVEVHALAFDPISPSTIYAGAQGTGGRGGVFKSIDGGANWVSLNSGFPTPDLPIEALALDPSNASVLYAAAGRAGIFKTANAGGTWSSVLSTGASFVTLAIDPAAPTTVYAGGWGGGTETNSGVFKTVDGGAAWAPKNSDFSWFPDVVAIALSPGSPSTVFALLGDRRPGLHSGAGLRRSTDGGEHWTNNFPPFYGLVYSLAVDPNQPSTIYAGAEGSESFGGTWAIRVFKSTNTGQTWSGTATFTEEIVTLAVDPSSPPTVLAGTYHRVYRSTDGGANWLEFESGLPSDLTSRFDVQSVYTIAFNKAAPQSAFVGTNRGAFRAAGGVAVAQEPAFVIPVVGSAPGNFGSFFRTGVQVLNRGGAAVSGRFIYHPAGVSGTSADPSLDFSIPRGGTISYADLVQTLGQTGLGSLDVVVLTPNGSIVVVTRVFNDAGAAGTSGFTEEAAPVCAAVTATTCPPFSQRAPGGAGWLIAPADPSRFRFNIGVRTLETGATLAFDVYDAAGNFVQTVPKAFGPNYFIQQSAEAFLGVPLLANYSVVSRVISSTSLGWAIVYGATIDNTTNDSSIQSSGLITSLF